MFYMHVNKPTTTTMSSVRVYVCMNVVRLCVCMPLKTYFT